MKDALFIVNPISGVGKHKLIEKKTAHLHKSGVQFDIAYTNAPKHATKIASENIGKYKNIVAVGGDGTVNEVSKALKNTNTALAIIPTGSGNGLARFMKIPLKIDNAIQNVFNGQITKIDTATFNDNHFVNVSGIGFDALIGTKFADFGKRGPIPYIYLALKEFKQYIPKKYIVIADKQKLTIDAFLISFANSSQYGNNAYIAPDAISNDGKIDVSIIKPFKSKDIPNIGYRLFAKNLNKSKFIKSFKASDIEITMPENEYQYHIDGEPFIGKGNIFIKVEKENLKIVVPETIAK